MKLACVVLASGHSKRFGSDKLVHRIDGIMMTRRCLKAIPGELFSEVIVVTRSFEVAELADELGFRVVPNADKTDDIAVTIRLGLDELSMPVDGCMFSVCDQPYLTSASVSALIERFSADMSRIVALSWNKKRGNPVVFPASLLGELQSLPSRLSGSHVIDLHNELLTLVLAKSAKELHDVDTPEDIK